MSNCTESRRVPIDQLRLPVTPFLHRPSKQIKKAKNFLNAFGQIPRVFAAENGEILGGEEIWLAAKERGDEQIDAVFVIGKTPNELTAIRIWLHRISQDAKWDTENLRVVIDGLINDDFDVSLTGFDTPEIDAVLNLDLPEANVEANDADIPKREQRPVSKLGDIWQLGKHRVGCGSSVNGEFVARLMNSTRAALSLSDPPYNIKVDGFISGKGKHRHREFVSGAGEMSDTQFCMFLQAYLSVALANCTPNALAICFIDWRHVCEMTVAGRLLGLPLYQIVTWVKSNGGMGGIWRNQSEFACVFQMGDQPPTNNVELGKHGRNRTNVWHYPGFSSFSLERDELLGLHPTVKPVAMLADAMKDVTRRGDVVLDSFLGSGSTLIAAEETGRVCCGVELDPLYVDVAVRRWQNKTGRSAVCAQTGQRFDDRALVRGLPAPVPHAE